MNSYRKDGTKVWTVISAKTEYDTENNALKYDGYIYDISARVEALENLKDSEEMFRAISHNLTNALYIFDESGKFIYVNPALTTITGYSEKELFDKKFYSIIHPEQHDLVKKRGFDRLSGKNVPKRYEIEIITKKGENKWLEVAASIIRLKNRNVVIGSAKDITEQKKALELVKKNEEKYINLYSLFRLMADNVPDMIWATDLDGNFIFVNKGICSKLLNVENTDEPIGKGISYFADKERKTHPDDPGWFSLDEQMSGSDKAVTESKKPYRFQISGNVTGRFLCLDVLKAPLFDDDAKMIGIVGSARDITQEIQIRKNNEREEKLKSVVFNISGAVNTTRDLNEFLSVIRLELSNVIDTSNMFIAFYDSEMDELSFPYFVDEKDRFKKFSVKKSLTHYLVNKNTPLLLHEDDYRALALANEIEIIGSPAKVWLGVPLNVKGKIIGALVVQNYNDPKAFTERDLELMKFVSNQISFSIYQKKADDAIRESEFRLRQIIDAVPHMIFAKDRNNKFILANKATADAYGLDVDEIEGKYQYSIHKNKNELKRFFEEDEFVLANNEIRVIEGEFTNYKGETRFSQTIKIPLVNGIEQDVAILGVAIDITERKNWEIELKKAKEKAEESDRLKTAFLANMSHEIRTPMNAIVGFAELLNDPDLSKQKRSEFISLIGQNSKLLLNLLQDIIDVAKIEAELLKVNKSACHINRILDELGRNYTQQLQYQSKSIEISIVKDTVEDDFAILTDPLRFKQIMNNLIANAIKFTEKGRVEFGYKLKSDIVEFYISDTGIGLKPDRLNFIFERFRQGEESSTREYGGTGLGLTISRRLVELLGGKIWVDSVQNEGSTFYFTLPLKIEKGIPKIKSVQTISGSYDWSDKVILVAEDENSNFELVRAILSRTGAKIIRATNGKEAVDICLENMKIDIVLMDIRMPEMNGYEATKKIKSVKSDLPVISLTAYAMADDRQKSLEAGCDDYLAKPVKPQLLMNRIFNLLK